jgi:DNA-directed RNA polymerase subunit beta'
LKINIIIIDEAHDKVAQITKKFRRGAMTDDERYTMVTDVWRGAKEELERRLMETRHEESNRS